MRHSRVRRNVYPHLLWLALVLSILPMVVLPDVMGAGATAASRDPVAKLFTALVLPVERFREALGNYGTFTSVSCSQAPCVEWGQPPVHFNIAVRHATAAVPFWFVAQAVLLELALALVKTFHRRSADRSGG